MNKKILKLIKQGLSSREIARQLNIDSSTVRHYYINMNLKLNPGRIIEDRIKDYLVQKGKKVISKSGSDEFDLLVDGQKVDVKSGHRTKDGRYYKLQLQDITNRKTPKHFESCIDKFLLVFLDEVNIPIFWLSSSEVHIQSTLSIKSNLVTKYPLIFEGYLESRLERKVKNYGLGRLRGH